MIRSEKKLTELGKVFNSGNTVIIRERIGQLRDEEPLEGAVMMLASLYENNNDRELRQLIATLFNDVKERAIAAEVMEALKMSFSDETRIMLASSCWQSGLDYSDYAGSLAEIFLAADYSLALECFTVIENNIPGISGEDRIAIVKLLGSEPADRPDPLKQLTRELINLLK